MERSKPARLAAIAICGAVLISGCTDTLAYGERSGFNLAIRADAAENVPVEVNAGLQRRVVGLIPARGTDADGGPQGEAVNMFSNFDLNYDEDDDSLFGGKLTVGSSFASGAAATEIAGSVATVETIVRPVSYRLTDNEGARAALIVLGDYVAKGDAETATYLELAKVRGLEIGEGTTPTTSLVGTLYNPKNAEKNLEIARLLNLI